MFDKKKTDAKGGGIEKPASTEPEALKAVSVHTIPKEFYDGGLGQGKAHAAEKKKPPAKKPDVEKPKPKPAPPQPPAKKPEAAKPKPKSGGKMWLIVGLVFLLLMIGLAAYVYLVVLKEEPAPEPVPVEVVEEVIVEEIIEEDPIIEEEPEVIVPVYPIGLREYTLAKDSDSDQLSDVEENQVYGTNPLRPDDDSDGFIDGHEVFHLYDPSKFQPSDLIDGGVVRTSQNSVFGYDVYYPTNWSRDLLDADGVNVMYSSPGGEYVEIIVHPNKDAMRIDQWYLDHAPAVTAGQVQPVTTKQGYKGLLSPDSLSLFLGRDDVVYELRYDIGVRTDAQFLQTFVMMQNSFKMTTDPLYVPEEQEPLVVVDEISTEPVPLDEVEDNDDEDAGSDEDEDEEGDDEEQLADESESDENATSTEATP